MNSQKRRSKKHPLVRFFRAVFRLIRTIFGSGKTVKLSPSELAEIDRAKAERARSERAESKRLRILAAQELELAERYITVGALLDRVEWKIAASPGLEPIVATKIETRLPDVSLN